jgi:hypothetical protein
MQTRCALAPGENEREGDAAGGGARITLKFALV